MAYSRAGTGGRFSGTIEPSPCPLVGIGVPARIFCVLMIHTSCARASHDYTFYRRIYMRGLSFKLSNPKGVPLLQILTCVNVGNYHWYVVGNQNDTWDSHMERLLLDRFAYDGSSFYEIIKQEHFVIFLKLQAYFPCDKYEEILLYDDFQNSKCQILLLIHDCCYVDIYVKDHVVIEEIYQYVVSSGCQNVRYINDDSDTRTKMSVT